MANLQAVVKELQNLRAEQKDTSAILTDILKSYEDTAKKAERLTGQQEEDRREKNRVKKLRQPKSIGGAFVQGAVGANVYDMLSGAKGAFGFLNPMNLARLAGKGLMFGAAATALTSFAQSAIDYVFDNLDLDMDPATKESLASGTTTAINAALAAKFLGFRGRTSVGIGLGAAIGTQFGDEIANAIINATDKQIINVPNPFGDGDIPIDMKDPQIQSGIGMFAGALVGAMLPALATNPYVLGAAALVAGSLALTNLIAKDTLERSVKFLQGGRERLVGKGGLFTNEEMSKYEAGTLDPETDAMIVGTLQKALAADMADYQKKIAEGYPTDTPGMKGLEAKIYQYRQLLKERRFVSDEQAYKYVTPYMDFEGVPGGEFAGEIQSRDRREALALEDFLEYAKSIAETTSEPFPDTSIALKKWFIESRRKREARKNYFLQRFGEADERVIVGAGRNLDADLGTGFYFGRTEKESAMIAAAVAEAIMPFAEAVVASQTSSNSGGGISGAKPQAYIPQTKRTVTLEKLEDLTSQMVVGY